MRKVFIPAVIAAATLLMGAAKENQDIDQRVVHYAVAIKVNDDGSAIKTYDITMKVLKERALEGMREYTMSHSTSVETLEVLSAATVKADGRRIDVPKDNYQQTVNTGRGNANPAFSDRTSLTVIFPELEVNDTVTISYRIAEKEPLFPGHFSYRDSFTKLVAYDDIRVTVDAPAALKARYESRQFSQKVSEKGGRRIVEWKWKNSVPEKSTRRDWSVYDYEAEPGFVYSTYESYAQIAALYGERATPKAAVTDRIRKLANEIAGKRADPREVAHALYDWVATNIDYAGNCIGIGAVVPRDLSFVLDNKMGDCKDHATLLQALLAARGIASTQALVNAGSVYKLPAIPTVDVVNHVITYVPALELFLDSTSDSTPFGMLPITDQGKQVLLVNGFKDGLRTSTTKVGTNRQKTHTVVDVADDGSIAAKVDVEQTGFYAEVTRAAMRQLTNTDEHDIVKNALLRSGLSGRGSLKKDDPKPLLETYRYGVQMEVEKVLQWPGTGAFPIAPMWGTMAPVHGYVMNAFAGDQGHEFVCSSGTSVEEYVYHLPKDMEVVSVPSNVDLSSELLTYKAAYKLSGRELTVTRTYEDRTPGATCGAEVAEQYKQFAQKVLPDIKAQVLYKPRS